MKKPNVVLAFVLVFMTGFLLFVVAQEKAEKDQEPTWAVGDEGYVDRLGEPLREEDSVLSKSKTRLSRGTPVSVEDVKERWLRVAVSDGPEGWLLEGALSRSDPTKQEPKEEKSYEQREQEFLQGLEDFEEESQRATIKGGAEAPEKKAAVRGLNPHDSENFEKVDGDFEALNWVEEFNTYIDREKSEQLVQFIQEGKLK